MAGRSSFAAGAAARTVNTSAWSLLVNRCEEGGGAVLADSFHRTVAPISVVSWNGWIVSDEVGATATGIAAMARRNQVAQVVVPFVPINVINDKVRTARFTLRSNHPGNRLAAPVAWMGSGSDRIVERYSMNESTATGRDDGMIGPSNAAVVDVSNSGLIPPKPIPTFPGTVGDVTSHVSGQLSSELNTAIVANEVGHAANVITQGVC